MIHRPTRTSASEHAVAKPIVKKRKLSPYSLIWIVPILAAVAAGFYFRDYLANRGPEITLTFSDASGLREGDTKVMYRGVDIGVVDAIELNADHSSALIHVRLQRSQTDFARQGALFWIVRPEISYGGIRGLNTVLSGPYIDSAPGNGATATQFTGLQSPPAALGKGLQVVLHTPRLEHVQPDSPVYYRGIQVGTVESIQLDSYADGVQLKIFIQHPFEPLVRTNSQFWIVSGLDVKGGILTGVQMKLDSLRSLISGGVTFNSPEDKIGEPAKDGAQYGLYDEPKKEWLDWSPKIPLADDGGYLNADENGAPSGQEALNSAMKEK
jgi:paraquat-inducible protein B